MGDATHLLLAAEAGDAQAAGRLLPLVYDELRTIAAAQVAAEQPGRALTPTALVHKAYLRLAGGQRYDGRPHFFAAAGEAIRRILVEAARRRLALKRGGPAGREPVELGGLAALAPDEQVVAVHDALDALAGIDPEAAALVKLRFFAGMTTTEAAAALGLSVRSAHDLWAFARSWLRRALRPD